MHFSVSISGLQTCHCVCYMRRRVIWHDGLYRCTEPKLSMTWPNTSTCVSWTIIKTGAVHVKYITLYVFNVKILSSLSVQYEETTSRLRIVNTVALSKQVKMAFQFNQWCHFEVGLPVWQTMVDEVVAEFGKLSLLLSAILSGAASGADITHLT